MFLDGETKMTKILSYYFAALKLYPHKGDLLDECDVCNVFYKLLYRKILHLDTMHIVDPKTNKIIGFLKKKCAWLGLFQWIEIDA